MRLCGMAEYGQYLVFICILLNAIIDGNVNFEVIIKMRLKRVQTY